MKHLIALFVLTTFSAASIAHTGSHKLVCQSAKSSGSAQKIAIDLKRANSTGLINPTIIVTMENRKIELTTPDDMINYGNTFHNSPLKVITINAEVPLEKNNNSGYFTIVAIPETVKAYDISNKPVIWTLQNEKDECSDSNGRATFQGIIHGFIYENATDKKIDPQIMDCELTYNSGMAC